MQMLNGLVREFKYWFSKWCENYGLKMLWKHLFWTLIMQKICLVLYFSISYFENWKQTFLVWECVFKKKLITFMTRIEKELLFTKREKLPSLSLSKPISLAALQKFEQSKLLQPTSIEIPFWSLFVATNNH